MSNLTDAMHARKVKAKQARKLAVLSIFPHHNSTYTIAPTAAAVA